MSDVHAKVDQNLSSDAIDNEKLCVSAKNTINKSQNLMEVNKMQKGESTTLSSNVTTHSVESMVAGCDSVDPVLHCSCCECI